MAHQLQQYEESLSLSLWACLLAVQKLSWEFQKLKEDRSYSFLYRPVSQLLGVSVPLLKREDVKGTHHWASYGFTCMTMERT